MRNLLGHKTSRRFPTGFSIKRRFITSIRRRLFHSTILLLLLSTCIFLAGCQVNPPGTKPTSRIPPGLPQDETLPGAAPGASEQKREQVTVFVAASLTEVIQQVGALFEEQNPGIQLVYNIAGSQQLAHQLSQGAPADVFLSADLVQAEAVTTAGRAEEEQILPFAGNCLAIAVSNESSNLIVNFSDLARPGIILVVAAENVPAGRYFNVVLEKAREQEYLGDDFVQNVTANIVSYEENVKSVLNKVLLGEADAGVVYLSDVLQADPEKVTGLEIPDAFNTQATYYIVPIDQAAKREPVDTYIRFLLSDEIQPILSAFGLLNIR